MELDGEKSKTRVREAKSQNDGELKCLVCACDIGSAERATSISICKHSNILTQILAYIFLDIKVLSKSYILRQIQSRC